MKILKKVSVKQVLTEKSKETLLNSFESEKDQLHLACKQLEFEKRKLLKKQSTRNEKIMSHFEEELKARQTRIEQIEFQIEQLQILPLGTELHEKKIEAIEEVTVGDDWGKVNTSSEIIIKDGIVIEIR